MTDGSWLLDLVVKVGSSGPRSVGRSFQGVEVEAEHSLAHSRLKCDNLSLAGGPIHLERRELPSCSLTGFH